MVDLITETSQYVPCPWCGDKAAQVDHLLHQDYYSPRFRPWDCGECGKAYYLTVEKGVVSTEKVDGPAQYQKLVLLKIPPQQGPIYLVVSATQYRPEEPCGAGDEYFYDEHTCPTNWTGDIEMVIYEDSTDPHGLAEWVASIPAGALMQANGYGNTNLDTIGEDPLPGGGTIQHWGEHARRVLALFGVNLTTWEKS